MLTQSKFIEIVKKGYSLDIVFILQQIEADFSIDTEESAKVEGIIQTCKRKGLISDDEKLTLEGKALLAFLSSEEEILIKKKPVDDYFIEWWKAFPGTDSFEHKGRKFTGSRSLRADKENCRIKFNKILGEGEYTHTEMIEALKYDVLAKKEASIKEGQNKLKYLQNSLTYLNQRSFEPFIELIKKDGKVKETQNYDGVNI